MGTQPTLTFLGGTGTVTGSKYLLEANGIRILVDCGLFQGTRSVRQRNRMSLPIDASQIDAVLLTHAHLDHSGYLPVLCKQGFAGPVYCTSGTAALLRILLPDSGHLQEEDARYADRNGHTRGDALEPLYTKAEAETCLTALRVVDFRTRLKLTDGFSATFQQSGHILGAAWIQFDINGQRVTFSGNVGRPDDSVMNPPAALQATDHLIIESTYGDRRHSKSSPAMLLRDVVNRTVRRNGIVLIPAFAVGRAQSVLRLLATLRETGAIPEVPVYLNSPMAIDTTEIFCDHADEHRLTSDECRTMCGVSSFVNSADESRALNRRSGPMIVVSASGMASGGRVLHHLKAWLGDARNTVLFTGFQAAGTTGASIVAGAYRVKIHGKRYAVKADVAEITGLSAHADVDELVDWMRPLNAKPPTSVFITHGEPAASIGLQDRIGRAMGIKAAIPKIGQQVVLRRGCDCGC